MKRYWIRCPKCNRGGILITEEEQTTYSYCTHCYVILTSEHVDRLIEKGVFIEESEVEWPRYKSFDSDLKPMMPKIWDSGEWMMDWGTKFRQMFERHGWRE